MMNAYTMRNLMDLGNYNTSITREAFEAHFTKTKESIRITFNGWDGKSYDGESRNAKVIRTDYPGYEGGPVHQGWKLPLLHRRREQRFGEGHRRKASGSRVAGRS